MSRSRTSLGSRIHLAPRFVVRAVPEQACGLQAVMRAAERGQVALAGEAALGRFTLVRRSLPPLVSARRHAYADAARRASASRVARRLVGDAVIEVAATCGHAAAREDAEGVRTADQVREPGRRIVLRDGHRMTDSEHGLMRVVDDRRIATSYARTSRPRLGRSDAPGHRRWGRPRRAGPGRRRSPGRSSGAWSGRRPHGSTTGGSRSPWQPEHNACRAAARTPFTGSGCPSRRPSAPPRSPAVGSPVVGSPVAGSPVVGPGPPRSSAPRALVGCSPNSGCPPRRRRAARHCSLWRDRHWRCSSTDSVIRLTSTSSRSWSSVRLSPSLLARRAAAVRALHIAATCSAPVLASSRAMPSGSVRVDTHRWARPDERVPRRLRRPGPERWLRPPRRARAGSCG